ncbi:MAG: iron response transcriptional regulator IrrA [Pseudomonadota bacterium]
MADQFQMTGHEDPDDALVERLRIAGLRPTRQRLALAEILFGQGDRHVTAESLREEVVDAGHSMALATIYNTLHQFTRAGLLRELAVEGTKSYFDTNLSNHSHFLHEETGEVVDVPGNSIEIAGLPKPPDGTEITHVDVIVRVRTRR